MAFASSIVDRQSAESRFLSSGGGSSAPDTGAGTLHAWQTPGPGLVFDLLESAEFAARHDARVLAGKLSVHAWHVTGTSVDGDLLRVGLRLPDGSYQLAVKAAPGLRVVGVARQP